MKNMDEGAIEFEGEGDDDLKLTSSPHPHPMGIDTHVRIAKNQSSVFELIRRVDRGDLVLSPDFQRKDVWKRKDRSELIESILIGIPIPLIYLFEDEKGVRQIIDGKQRITALKKFLNNDFVLSKLLMLPELEGKKFDDLDSVLQAKLEDYQLHTYVIQPPTPEHVKFNIFERVNRSGVKLNKQEMRHALYLGKATDLIQELAESNEFKLATGKNVKPKRMRDCYLVLRFIGFYLLKTDQLEGITYRSDIDDFLASVMQFLNTRASDALIEKVKSFCLAGMNNVYQTLGNQAFRFESEAGKNRRPVNMGLFEMLVFSFCCIDVNHGGSDIAKQLVEKRKLEIDQCGLFSGSIDTNENVNERFNIAMNIESELKNA